MAAEFTAELLKIPPVTRFLCASQLAVSLSTMLTIVSPYKVILIWPLVLKRFEIWRIFTSFFLGGSGINFIFDFVMLYRNSNIMEETHYAARSADYAWQLLAAASGILALSYPLNAVVYTRPLLVALTYVSSQLSPPGTQSSIFGLVTIPVVYYPYMMVAMDLVMGGPSAAAGGVVGLVVGHTWWWGVFGGEGGRGRWASAAKAPLWMKKFFGDGPDVPPVGRGAAADGGAQPMAGVHVIAPRSRASGSAPATSSGYQWGSGQRLGT